MGCDQCRTGRCVLHQPLGRAPGLTPGVEAKIAAAPLVAALRLIADGTSGCSNHGCVIATRKGQGANGACRCGSSRPRLRSALARARQIARAALEGVGE